MCRTLALAAAAHAQIAPKFAADVPKSIQTSDTVETQKLGTLKFFDGMPDDATVGKVDDDLDLYRGVDASLNGIPAASIHASLEGFGEAGLKPGDLGIFEDLMDAPSLFLTANSTTVYALMELNDRDYKGKIPRGHFVARTPTYRNPMFFRALVE